MLVNHRLRVFLDCPVAPMLLPWTQDVLEGAVIQDIRPHDILVMTMNSLMENRDLIMATLDRDDVHVILDNSVEGSSTQQNILRQNRLNLAIEQGRIHLISGTPMPMDHTLDWQYFLWKVTAYPENRAAATRINEIFQLVRKPYTFLYTHGRDRPHRVHIWDQLNQRGLLPGALWSRLDGPDPVSLPKDYEVAAFVDGDVVGSTSYQESRRRLFGGTWGEIFLKPEAFRDSYFSLVTETVYDDKQTFFTEKIAKPIMQGHPWICAANAGFYRDLHALGFRTFNGIIDESFDEIQDWKQRMDAILIQVESLIFRDPEAFLRACEPVCKYNQQHLLELARKEKTSFPLRFRNFLKSMT